MRRRHNELALGISVTLATVLVVFGVLFLEQPTFLSGGRTLRIRTDDARGLSGGDPVRYRGLKIGTIRSVGLDGGTVLLSARIDRSVAIPTDSRFLIETGGVLEGTVLAIRPGTSEETLSDGALVEAETAGGVSNLLSRSDDIGQQLQSVLADLDRMAVRGLGTEVEAALGDVEAAASRLAAIVESNRDGIEESLAEAEEAAASLEGVLSAVERGEGSLGRLLEDERLYRNLNEALESVTELSTDMRENPDRYFQVTVF